MHLSFQWYLLPQPQSGPDERCIPGNTIAVQADMAYSGLSSFGTAFLSKFECSQMPHPVWSLSCTEYIYPPCCALVVGELNITIFFVKLLEHVTFVDTPGVLSGEKQRTQRSYDFTGVTSWFAAKCDLILLLFDPHKLDISDEFKRVIGSLRGHDDKIRIVLNKADQVDAQQASNSIFLLLCICVLFKYATPATYLILSFEPWYLNSLTLLISNCQSSDIKRKKINFQLMRVYGALLWSLGKVLNTPEVMRVYIGYGHHHQRPYICQTVDQIFPWMHQRHLK